MSGNIPDAALATGSPVPSSAHAQARPRSATGDADSGVCRETRRSHSKRIVCRGRCPARPLCGCLHAAPRRVRTRPRDISTHGARGKQPANCGATGGARRPDHEGASGSGTAAGRARPGKRARRGSRSADSADPRTSCIRTAPQTRRKEEHDVLHALTRFVAACPVLARREDALGNLEKGDAERNEAHGDQGPGDHDGRGHGRGHEEI